MIGPPEELAPFDPGSLPMSNWPADVKPFEPIYGWMQRAARENYALSAESFISSLGLNSRDWDFEEQLEIASQLPLRGLRQLAWCTPTKVPEGIEICGHRLAGRFFAKSEGRVCPSCLEDSRHQRVWFNFAPLAACPIHDALLISGLADDPIDWRNPDCGWTRNGVKLSSVHSSHTKASALDHYIVQSFSSSSAGCPDHLSSETMNAVIHAAICIGKLSLGWNSFGESHEDLRDLSQRGFTPLSEGADSIIEFLARSPWLDARSRTESQMMRLRHAATVIRVVPSKKLRSLLADCFGAVRIKNRLSTPSGHYARLGERAGYWNLESAAVVLDLPPSSLSRIVKELKIVPECDRRGHAFRLSAEQIDSVKVYKGTCLSSSEVATSLGCAITDVDELVQRKALSVKFRAQGERYFSKQEIERFVDLAIKRQITLPAAGLIPLGLFASTEGVSLPEAYTRLVRGAGLRLVHMEDGAPFFKAAHVAVIDDTKRNSSYRIRPQAQVRDSITFASAAARLGTGSNGMKQLIDMGFLRVDTSESGERRVSEDSLNDFASRYVRAAAYAPLLGCNPLSAIKSLRKHGVVPINEGRRHNVKFVDRAEVERLTGFKLSSGTGFEEWEELAQQLVRLSAEKQLPATIRVLATPAIAIKATTGRWAFLVTQGPQKASYRLVSNFRAAKEPARVRKIEHAEIDPNSIWPGAELIEQPTGGFVLHDQLASLSRAEESNQEMIAYLVERAFQLHRLL